MKILVIENEELVRAGVLELLEAENFDAIGAENGRVGVQLAQDYLPDLILCDVMMPELDGYGVLNVLQQNASTANIPFILLTTKATHSDLQLPGYGTRSRRLPHQAVYSRGITERDRDSAEKTAGRCQAVSTKARQFA